MSSENRWFVLSRNISLMGEALDFESSHAPLDLSKTTIGKLSYHLQNEFHTVNYMLCAIFDVINSVYPEKVSADLFADVYYNSVMDAIAANYLNCPCVPETDHPEYIKAVYFDMMRSAVFADYHLLIRATKDHRMFHFAFAERISRDGLDAICIRPMLGVDD